MEFYYTCEYNMFLRVDLLFSGFVNLFWGECILEAHCGHLPCTVSPCLINDPLENLSTRFEEFCFDGTYTCIGYVLEDVMFIFLFAYIKPSTLGST